jgi:hypothetical protein
LLVSGRLTLLRRCAVFGLAVISAILEEPGHFPRIIRVGTVAFYFSQGAEDRLQYRHQIVLPRQPELIVRPGKVELEKMLSIDAFVQPA